MTETTPTISRALAEYLTDWLAWVDRGAPDGEPYVRFGGLCFNTGIEANAMEDELCSLLGGNYPFGGSKRFDADFYTATMHLNEARLAWCRSTLATAEIEG